MKFDRDNIVLIYSNINNLSKFDAGRIIHVFQNEVLYAHYLPNGKYDGYRVIANENIVKVEMNSLYSQKIQTLVKYHKTKHDDIVKVEDNGFISLLNYAKDFNKVVTVELVDSGRNDIIGYVNKIEDETCFFDQRDDFGNMDGQAIVDISDITYISCDGDDESIIEILSKIKDQKVKN